MTARPLIVGLGWLDRPGGLERYTADLRAALDDPPTVVLATHPSRDPGLLVAASPDDPLPRRLLAVRRTVRDAVPGADVLDLHFPLTGVGALLARAARRQPRVVHFHGPWADEGPRRGRAARRTLERVVYRSAERFVVLSGAMGRVLIERYGADPWRVRVIPPGVDLERFTPDDRAGARGGLGLEPDAYVVVTVRRLVERVGIAVLLEAWARALPSLPAGATLLIAGDGPQRPALAAQIDDLAIGSSATLLGPVDDATLVALYRAADVVAVPSLRLEGFGLVAVEALACGTPVLATACGGLPDAVAGLGMPLVAPGDADALADAIVASARGDRPTAAECRARAERFSWEVAASRHRDLYVAAAARDGGPARRVVVVDHSAARSGGEIAMARLAAALPSSRVHAVLFEDGPFTSLLSQAGATTEVRPLGRANRVDRRAAGRPATLLRHGATVGVQVLRLAWRLRRLRPTVVHANSLKAGLVGGVAARLARVPMVWHIRDRLAPDYLPPRTIRILSIAVRRLPTAVIVPSTTVLDTLGAPGRRRVERAVIPDPYAAPPASRARRSDGDERVHVVMIGRIARWKGQDVFVRAFAEAFPDGDARGTVVGGPVFGADDDAYAAELDALVGGLPRSVDLTLTGARDDVERILATADVVVHASRTPEPFGQVVVEAMAAGAAVIATEGGGPSELIRHDVDGLLLPAGDVSALATALRRLADHPEERERLGAQGRARVEELCDPARIGAEVAAVYERAAVARP